MTEIAAPARQQLDGFLEALKAVLTDQLVAVYLHGSLATDSFEAARSDIDVLAITANALTTEQRRGCIAACLNHSLRPAPLEISILQQSALQPFMHPSPFEFHYGEDHRETYASGGSITATTDVDLACHIAMTRARGQTLVGPAASELLPEVKPRDLIDSLRQDFLWARSQQPQLQDYLRANAARTIAWLTDGQFRSKREALAEGWLRSDLAGMELADHVLAALDRAARSEDTD